MRTAGVWRLTELLPDGSTSGEEIASAHTQLLSLGLHTFTHTHTHTHTRTHTHAVLVNLGDAHCYVYIYIMGIWVYGLLL